MSFKTSKYYFFLLLGFISFSCLAQQLAIPSYFYPNSSNCNKDNTCYWSQLNKGASVIELAIINPNSGVGTNLKTNYLEQTQSSQEAGISILGYVYSDGSIRDINVLKDEIDKYFQWYRVDGIFVDESSNNCDKVNYYKELYEYIKSKSLNQIALVVLNPGTKTEECYLEVADILLTFEGGFDEYNNDKLFPELTWEKKYPSNRFWHLIYNTSESDIERAIFLSRQRNAGYVYVTDDTFENDPWDTLPLNSYWTTELSLFKPKP